MAATSTTTFSSIIERYTPEFIKSSYEGASDALDRIQEVSAKAYEAAHTYYDNYKTLLECDVAFVWYHLPDEADVKRAKTLYEDLPEIKDNRFQYLTEHFGSDLFVVDDVTIHPTTKSWAFAAGCYTGACASHETVYITPIDRKSFYPVSVDHEITHALLHVLVDQNNGEFPIPLWFNEAAAMETSGGLLGQAYHHAWSHSRRQLHPDNEKDCYVYGAAFYATWVTTLGEDAWNELIKEYIFESSDIYVAIAEVAERYGKAGFETKEATVQSVQEWRNSANQLLTAEAKQQIRELNIPTPFGPSSTDLDLARTEWNDYVRQVKNHVARDPEVSQRVQKFVRNNPESPYHIEYYAFLLIDALVRKDTQTAQAMLTRFRQLTDKYQISTHRVPVEELQALIYLQQDDLPRFREALDQAIFPEDNVYTQEYNDLLRRFQTYPDKWPITSYEEFKKEFTTIALT